MGVTLPPPKLEKVGRIWVVRDDLVAGGTKVRFLEHLMEPGREYVFGAPAQGYAQVALAYAAKRVGARATVFVAQRKQLHPLTAEAAAAGARVVQTPIGRMSLVQHRARAYCQQTGARFFPLGFDEPQIRELLTEVALGLHISPDEVWATAGTGMLSRCLQAAWPNARHHAVRIGFPPNPGRALLWTAPERFDQVAKAPPPFPSCANYDAKAWQFVEREASPGALFWNVAA